LAELLKIEGFKASNGWLDNFKDRHGIVFKSVQGEAAAVDLESVDKWRQDILIKLLAEYSPKSWFCHWSKLIVYFKTLFAIFMT
jgi:hypothetical protein